MAPKILLIRCQSESESVEAQLIKKGYDAIISPLLEIAPLPRLSIKPADGYIITSQNAAKVLKEGIACPLYSIGAKTTAVLKSKGFKNIFTAKEDGPSLIKLIKKKASKKDALIHLSGEKVATDIATILQEKGYAAERQIVYETKYLSQFTPEALAALKNQDIFAVLFYSRESAKAFKKVIYSEFLANSLRQTYALSFSNTIDFEINSIEWKKNLISKEKTTDSLIERLDQLRAKCQNKRENSKKVMMTENNSPLTPSKKQYANGWILFLIIIFLGAGAWIYFNPALLNFFEKKEETIELTVSEYQLLQDQLQKHKSLLESIHRELEILKFDLKDARTNQGFMMNQLKGLESKAAIHNASPKLPSPSPVKEALKAFQLKVEKGLPFAEEYKILETFLDRADKETLGKLYPYCKIGTPRPESLIKGFEEVEISLISRPLPKASEPSPSASWADSLLNRVKKLVIISKKGGPLPGVEGHVLEIKKQINEGNFEGAFEISQGLPYATPAKEKWEQHLQAYIETRKVLRHLASTLSSEEKGNE